MINFSTVQFIKSAPTRDDRPSPHLHELVFIGRSNVGKSSLINAITGHTIAKVSSKPGKTVLLNYYNVDDHFYLVDAPGYGYTKTGSRHTSNFAVMMEGYFHENQELKGIIFLLDSRHAPSNDDIAFHDFAITLPYPLIYVFTKVDKLTQKELASFRKSLNSLGWDISQSVYTSITKRASLDPLKSLLAKLLTL